MALPSGLGRLSFRSPQFLRRATLTLFVACFVAALLYDYSDWREDAPTFDTIPPPAAAPIVAAAPAASDIHRDPDRYVPSPADSPFPTRPSIPSPPAMTPVAPRVQLGGLGLPFERALAVPAEASDEEQDNAMAGAAFSVPQSFEELQAQTQQDPDAAELTRLYRRWVEQAMSEARMRSRLVGFVCGVRICFGEFDRGTEQEFLDWTRAFSTHLDRNGSALQTAIWFSPDGAPHMRFAFSIRKTP